MLQSEESRQGIALVIVLAFLTILILMAVLFVTLMRTERVASRNHMDIVRARHFVHTGMARAIEDVIAVLPTAPPTHPDWPNRSFFSDQTPARNRDILALGDGDLRSYFPYGDTIWDQVRASVNAGEVHWDLIEDPDNAGQFPGRISYWVFDCSGLLDVNIVHDPTITRDRGIAPAEIRLSALMESVQNPALLGDNRDEFVRYASVAELARLGSVPVVAPAGRFLSVNDPPKAVGFVNFSHFPSQYPHPVTGIMRDPIDISTLANITAQRGNILEVLQWPEYGLDAAEAEVFFVNLVDFCDPDNLPVNYPGPVNLNSICTEAVPMLNEVHLRSRVGVQDLGLGDTNYIVALDVEVEVWYPFPTVENLNEYSVSIDLVGLYNPPLPAAQRLLPDTWDAQSRSVGSTWSNPEGVIQTVSFRATKQITSSGQAPELADQIVVTLRVNDDQNQPVDELRIGEAWKGSPDFAQIPAAGVIEDRVLRKDCLDPRINWNWTAHWDTPLEANGSMGQRNERAITAAEAEDGTWQMFVANRNLENVGELGLLLFRESEPWKTVPLFGPDAWPVWRDFTIQSPPLTRGLVHPNTPEIDVIRAAFLDVVPERFPGGGGAAALEWDDLENFALEVVNANSADLRVGVSDFPEVALQQLGLETRLDEKAVLRHAGELFSPRQQIFTIVVEAQALAPEIGGNINSVEDHEILASQKALAVIWRDPYGQEPTITQYFEWLTD